MTVGDVKSQVNVGKVYGTDVAHEAPGDFATRLALALQGVNVVEVGVTVNPGVLEQLVHLLSDKLGAQEKEIAALKAALAEKASAATKPMEPDATHQLRALFRPQLDKLDSLNSAYSIDDDASLKLRNDARRSLEEIGRLLPPGSQARGIVDRGLEQASSMRQMNKGMGERLAYARTIMTLDAYLDVQTKSPVAIAKHLLTTVGLPARGSLSKNHGIDGDVAEKVKPQVTMALAEAMRALPDGSPARGAIERGLKEAVSQALQGRGIDERQALTRTLDMALQMLG